MARGRLSRAESRQRTRARLVEAAIGLFARQGVAGTSLELISETAGYSRGAFHSNFDGRDDLVDAVASTVVEAIEPSLRAVLHQDDRPTLERLADYIRTFLTFCHDRPDPALALAAIVAYRTRADATSYRELAEASVEDLVRLFDQGQARGEMRPFDSHRMATTLRLTLDAEASAVRAGMPTADREGAIHELVALFSRATTA